MKHYPKYFIVALFTLLSSHLVHGMSIVQRADSAYNETAYALALELYNDVLDSIGVSSDLYYNIGNTYYRLGDLGHSVLWYERALQLDPTNRDARENLKFVNTRIADKPTDNRSIVTRIYDQIVNSTSANNWSWITFCLFTLSVVALIGYLVSSRVMIRKTYFFGGGILVTLTIVALIVSFSSSSKISNHNNGIITSPSAMLSTAPREATDASTQAFMLHEGTKVEIVDSVIPSDIKLPRWYEVKIGNARAWINGKDIERI